MPSSTELIRLLSENSPPTPLQASELRERISELDARLAVLDVLASDIERDRAQYNAILSPIRRIPLEVIGEIIATAVPTTLKDHHSRQRLIELCTVSRDWCNAAHCLPELWRGIILKIYTTRLAYSKVAAWLRRAGSLTRMVLCHQSGNRCLCDRTGNCVMKSALVAKLLFEDPPIDHLTLNVDSIRCLKAFFDLYHAETAANTSASSLSSLSLYLRSGTPDDWMEPNVPSQSVFTKLPPVTSLELRFPQLHNIAQDIAENYGPHLTDAQLSRLTDFSIGWDWINTKFFSVLRRCINVVTLTISFNRCDSMREPALIPSLVELSSQPIRLPSVRTLRLMNMDGSLLEYIVTPKLMHLHLNIDGDLDDGTVDVPHLLTHFITRSDITHTINSIRIDQLSCSSWDLRQALYQLPSLTHLVLVDPLNFNSIFTDPYTTGLPDTQFPALTHLELHAMPTSYDPITVTRYLSLRKGPRACLLSFSYMRHREVTSTEPYPPVNYYPPRELGET
ncbi:hypothetical protein DFP72DRAFT_843848 [Ephemerocybe angulata]|uniref:F-box domain-containing protein n=1 Tax=Ephemerocybe angulata TaxID=980116 RepID=A0A8H6I8A3_9AGAR|nr:hypothetical protein DFP72DRAFT_843848 [Tulosesus angulatus]